MPSPSVLFSLSADGKSVAEAQVADAEEARLLVAAARSAGSDLAWAHCKADLSGLGFSRQSGYRRLEGPAPIAASTSGPAAISFTGSEDASVGPLPAGEETADLWAAAFRGQWGHKTAEHWPLALPPGTMTLGLRQDGTTVGVCRVQPADGLIDAPGLIPPWRDVARYRTLLLAALGLVTSPNVTVESWGDAPERVAACERLGLATVEYVPGWELSLHS